MSALSDGESESDAVLAFMRERQADVLADAVAQLDTCTRDELPAVVHALYGSVGSYQLHAAHERIAALSSVLSDSTSTRADVDSAWATTLEALRAMEKIPST
jgi:hypothetical protein